MPDDPTPTEQRRRKREPVSSRVLQAVILAVGLMLLIAAMAPGMWGPLVVGVLLAATVIPPVRPLIDRWLTGDTSGQRAEQAALFRAGAGVLLIVLALAGVLRF